MEILSYLDVCVQSEGPEFEAGADLQECCDAVVNGKLLANFAAWQDFIKPKSNLAQVDVQALPDGGIRDEASEWALLRPFLEASGPINQMKSLEVCNLLHVDPDVPRLVPSNIEVPTSLLPNGDPPRATMLLAVLDLVTGARLHKVSPLPWSCISRHGVGAPRRC